MRPLPSKAGGGWLRMLGGRIMNARLIRWGARTGLGGLLGFYGFHVYNLLHTREVGGLSLPAFTMLLAGCVGFTALGVLTRNGGLAVANGVGRGVPGLCPLWVG